jgi:hypothetical protein
MISIREVRVAFEVRPGLLRNSGTHTVDHVFLSPLHIAIYSFQPDDEGHGELDLHWLSWHSSLFHQN